MTWDFPVASPLALRGIAWIEARVGARYRGWVVRGDRVVVECAREDQVVEEYSAKTLDEALRLCATAVKGERRAA